MPYNPKSKANLGKLKTKFKRKNFNLCESACNYLANFANETAEIERLIAEKCESTPVYDPSDLIV